MGIHSDGGQENTVRYVHFIKTKMHTEFSHSFQADCQAERDYQAG